MTDLQRSAPAIVDTECAVCEQVLPPVYFLCDVTMQAYCPDCFDQHPCGQGKHGEGCPTQVFVSKDTQ